MIKQKTDIKIPTLRDAQLCELDILKFFDKLCRENNLRYYLVGGTLLGAVRHNGFIPWDDDVDVAMPRDDYEKFALLCKTNSCILQNKYFYQDETTDKGYCLTYAKLRLKNTIAYEPAFEKTKMQERGFFIDIFPLDYCPNPGKLATLIYKVFSLFYFRGFRDSGFVYKPLRRFRWKVGFVFTYLLTKRSCIKIRKRIIAFGTKKSTHEYVASYSGAYGFQKEIFKEDMFGVGTDLPFEGYEFMVPIDYERQLMQIYGEDYMTLPDDSKKRHHLILEKCVMEGNK